MTRTRDNAYLAIQADGTSARTRWIVLDAIRSAKKPVTRKQIVRRVRKHKLELSSVCGRVRELLDMGLVEVAGEEWNRQTKKNNQTLCAAKRKHDLFGEAA